MKTKLFGYSAILLTIVLTFIWVGQGRPFMKMQGKVSPSKVVIQNPAFYNDFKKQIKNLPENIESQNEKIKVFYFQNKKNAYACNKEACIMKKNKSLHILPPSTNRQKIETYLRKQK